MKRLNIVLSEKPALAESITAFEIMINIKLPEEYKKFLMMYNPYVIKERIYRINSRSFEIHHFYPFNAHIRLSVQKVYDYLSDHFEGKFIAFADDPGGWQFVISLRKKDYGCIYFCRMDEEVPEALTYLASSFNSFLENLTEE